MYVMIIEMVVICKCYNIFKQYSKVDFFFLLSVYIILHKVVEVFSMFMIQCTMCAHIFKSHFRYLN